MKLSGGHTFMFNKIKEVVILFIELFLAVIDMEVEEESPLPPLNPVAPSLNLPVCIDSPILPETDTLPVNRKTAFREWKQCIEEYDSLRSILVSA